MKFPGPSKPKQQGRITFRELLPPQSTPKKSKVVPKKATAPSFAHTRRTTSFCGQCHSPTGRLYPYLKNFPERIIWNKYYMGVVAPFAVKVGVVFLIAYGAGYLIALLPTVAGSALFYATVYYIVNFPDETVESLKKDPVVTLVAFAGGCAGAKAASLRLKIPSISKGSAIELGGGRRFHHFTNKEGVEGITGINASKLKVGEEIIVTELKFGYGKNSFLTKNAGEIFVTEKGPCATIGQLNQIGVFGNKQNFVIIFSEETAFMQGAKVAGQKVSRSIYTIPGFSHLKGNFIVKRIR